MFMYKTDNNHNIWKKKIDMNYIKYIQFEY